MAVYRCRTMPLKFTDRLIRPAGDAHRMTRAGSVPPGSHVAGAPAPQTAAGYPAATRIEIIGAGVSGLCCALLFAERGCQVSLTAASDGPDAACCSWWAGGMLAPWCERENADPLIAALGVESLAFWQRGGSDVQQQGSLVIASNRDLPDLRQFAARTEHYQPLDGPAIDTLEPELAGRFSHGLYFEDECHLDPRRSLQQLVDRLAGLPNVRLQFGQRVPDAVLMAPPQADWRIDCRGLAARDQLPDLRGVKGEMLLLHQPELRFRRPVRLLHPRYPLYIVPREHPVFMVGATVLETDDRRQISARSVMELLSAACALHPGFAEATLLETGTDARPAFIDNLPRVRQHGRTVFVNGLYRHGFLCGPAVCQRAVDLVLDGQVDTRLVELADRQDTGRRQAHPGDKP